MADSQKSFWVGAAFVVVIAITGVTLWKVAAPNDNIAGQLAALNSKIDATNAVLAKIQAASASTAINDKLSALDSQIAKTNAALAELQKGTQLKSLAQKLDTLNTGIKRADTALADITKSIPQSNVGNKIDSIGGKIDAIAASMKTIDGTLTAIKQSAPAQDLSAQLTAVDAKIKSLNENLAPLQKAGAGAAAGKTAALSEAVGDLQKNVDAMKKNIDDASALGAKLADQVAKLQAAAKAAAKPKPSDLVFVYLHMPNEQQMPKTVATVSPFTVQFAHIGSTKPDAGSKVIIGKLKDIIKGRKDCTISVVGYADTLGSDNVNLQISKRRARAVAAELKAAFSGSGVQINQAAWGERRLKNWTPDKTPSLANRRVDVAVTCKQ